MGNLQLQQDKGLKLMSLNFFTLAQNPFQFYSQQNTSEADKLNSTLKVILKRQLRLTDIQVKNFSWDVGDIDKKFTQGRCAVQLDPNACFVETDNKDKYRLMTRKEFKEEWKKRFEDFKPRFGRDVPTESEQLNCMVMDFIFYATVVEERFKVTIDEVDKVKVEDVEKLRRKLSQKHEAVFLQPNMKKKRLIHFIKKNKIDVVFLQQLPNEIHEKDWTDSDGLHGFEVVINKDGRNKMAILFNKEKFGERDLTFQKQNYKHIKVIQDIVFCKVGDFLLVSAHFSSSKLQIVQSHQFLEMIIHLKKDFSNLKIIAGVNSNMFIEQSELQAYPDNQQLFTSLKKRTLLQAQFNKANIDIKEVKDHLVSTESLFDCRILQLNSLPPEEDSYVPSQKHPFPNFIVFGRINP